MESDLEQFEGATQRRKRRGLIIALSPHPVRAAGFTHAPAPAQKVSSSRHTSSAINHVNIYK